MVDNNKQYKSNQIEYSYISWSYSCARNQLVIGNPWYYHHHHHHQWSAFGNWPVPHWFISLTLWCMHSTNSSVALN